MGQVQADELRIKVQGAVLRMAMAVMVSTRLWLGGEVGVTRHIYQGTEEAVAAVIKQTQGKGQINTAFIERINGTFQVSVVKPFE